MKGRNAIQSITEWKDGDAVTFDLSSINGDLPTVNENTSKELLHHVFANGAWEHKAVKSHPRVDLLFSTEECDYTRFGYPCPQVSGKVSAIVDSGAQCCVWGLPEFLRAGFTDQDFIPVKQGLSAVSKSGLKVLGVVFLHLSGTPEYKRPILCGAFTYVSSDVYGLYLSQHTMIQLQIVPPDYPSVGAEDLNGISGKKPDLEIGNCGCPKCSLPPGLTDQLPFTATEENNEKMKQWLLERYSGSTFNTCPHQTLPNMTGPDVEIHIDPKAKPTSVMSLCIGRNRLRRISSGMKSLM